MNDAKEAKSCDKMAIKAKFIRIRYFFAGSETLISIQSGAPVVLFQSTCCYLRSFDSSTRREKVRNVPDWEENAGRTLKSGRPLQMEKNLGPVETLKVK